MDVFEKDVTIPKQQWQSGFQPQITFTVTDTAASYNVYLVVRHTDAYDYNNIWIKATVQQPNDPVAHSQRFNLALATNEKGWMGSAMDDIYEHRVLVQPQTKFKKPGDYHFTLEQIMREDPLLHVMNVGVRVEKVK
jgi:gliding motility-associated lipoprotein GldH